MISKLSALNTVALLVPSPGHGLVQGQVGTIVEELDADVFEVEFCDDTGATYALLVLPAKSLIALHYSPVAA